MIYHILCQDRAHSNTDCVRRYIWTISRGYLTLGVGDWLIRRRNCAPHCCESAYTEDRYVTS